MTTTTIAPSRQESISLGRIPLAALIGGVTGAVANAIVFLLSQAAGITAFVQTPDGQTLPLMLVPVIFASIVPAIGAGALLAALARFTRRPVRIFQIIAAVFLVISLPLMLEVDLTSKAVLSLMHIIAAAAITWSLSTRTRAH